MSIGESRKKIKEQQSQKISADIETFFNNGGQSKTYTAYDNAAVRQLPGFKGHTLGEFRSQYAEEGFKMRKNSREKNSV